MGIFVSLLVLAGIAVAAFLAREWIGDTILLVEDRLIASEAVNPTNVTPSSEAPERGVALVHDGITNTSWTPATPGPGEGEFIDFTFAEPFRLVYLQVFNGASPEPDLFLAEARPRSLLATIQKSDGGTSEQIIRLADEPGVQQFTIAESDVQAVRLTIQSSRGAENGTAVALGEVSFRGR